MRADNTRGIFYLHIVDAKGLECHRHGIEREKREFFLTAF